MVTWVKEMEFPVLFKEDGSKIRIWKITLRVIKKCSRACKSEKNWNPMEEIEVPISNEFKTNFPDDLVVQYWTETGFIDGKIMRSLPTYPTGKNLNKKNFRNPFNQALAEIDSKITKKKQEGFEESNNLNIKERRIFPMLAKIYLEDTLIKYPVYCQPKLDGLRCISFSDGSIILQSRTKKDFPNNPNNDRIRSELESIFPLIPPGAYLDGEIYNHHTKLQHINHYAKNSDKYCTEPLVLQYHIYDVLIRNEDLIFEKRLEFLSNLKTSECIQVVPTVLVETKEQLDKLYTKYIQDGFEGMMIRDPNGVYCNKRTNFLLKRKEVYTAEYQIIDYTCGNKGKDFEAVIWICQTDKHIRFKVTPCETYEERYKLYKQCKENFVEHFKHRLLTVEYRSLSEDYVPLHGKGIYIRDIE